MEEINSEYNKWLISFQIDGAMLYSVWGSDSTDNYDDKLWVDTHQRIITFGQAYKTVEAILNEKLPLFDSKFLYIWAENIIESGHSIIPSIIYDMDLISQEIKNVDFDILENNNSNFMLELINFINLFGDYAVQVKDDMALQFWRSTSLRIFWEFMYNIYFWKIPQPELTTRQKELLKNYEADDCRQSLEKIISIFKRRIYIQS